MRFCSCVGAMVPRKVTRSEREHVPGAPLTASRGHCVGWRAVIRAVWSKAIMFAQGFLLVLSLGSSHWADPLQQPPPRSLFPLGRRSHAFWDTVERGREQTVPDCHTMRVDGRMMGMWGRGKGDVVEWSSAQEHGHASILVRPAPFTRPPR